MPPMTMTEKQLKGLIDEIVTPIVGSTIDERLKEFQSQQQRSFGEMLAGANGRATAGAAAAKASLVGMAMLAVAGAKLAGRGLPADYAKTRWGADAAITKALSAGDAANGGAMIPEEMSSDFIELLRPAAIITRLNPTFEPMDSGNLTIAKLTGGAVAGYIGENQNAPKTQPTTGGVRLSARKLAALVPISNDLIRRTRGRAESTVRDDGVAAMAQRGDLAMIRGLGTEYAPKGLRYWAPSANVITANATVNLQNTVTDLGKLVTQLGNANVQFRRPGWGFSWRTYVYLYTLLTANGVFAFRDELARGTLWGWPFGVTTQIPNNIGGTSVGSEVYLADFSDVVVGQATQLLVDTSTEAAYHDGSVLVAAFSQDQTVVRLILEHDLVLRHDEAVAVLDDARWV